jgi:hypothetical protein
MGPFVFYVLDLIAFFMTDPYSGRPISQQGARHEDRLDRGCRDGRDVRGDRAIVDDDLQARRRERTHHLHQQADEGRGGDGARSHHHHSAITIIPATPVPVVQRAAEKGEPAKQDIRPAMATVTVPSKQAATTLAAIEPQVQKRRDEDRRRILEQELVREEQSLAALRASLLQEQQNPVLVAAVRTAQQAADPTPAQMAEMRANIEKASGRIRGLQATAAEHEKNIEALKKELGAIK